MGGNLNPSAWFKLTVPIKSWMLSRAAVHSSLIGSEWREPMRWATEALASVKEAKEWGRLPRGKAWGVRRECVWPLAGVCLCLRVSRLSSTATDELGGGVVLERGVDVSFPPIMEDPLPPWREESVSPILWLLLWVWGGGWCLQRCSWSVWCG